MVMVKIKVTQDCIDYGTRDAIWACPVALAARQAGLVNVSVGSMSMAASDSKNERISALLTDDIQKLIENFDHGKGMQPFEFKITLTQ